MSERVHPPFADAEHQRASVTLGMWVFLAQETLFFGVLFVLYTVMRLRQPAIFLDYAPRLDWPLATAMTATLLLSSFTMVLAVRCALLRRRGPLLAALAGTIVLGLGFLAMKASEYAGHIQRGEFPGPGPAGADTFFGLYFTITGFHALHVIGGLIALTVLTVAALRQRPAQLRSSPVLAVGLYWHFVDIVWLFVFPSLYLVGRAT